MRIALRVLSFGIGACIFLWCYSHAGGFHPDGSPVDPDPPPFFLVIGGSTAGALLWLYALGGLEAFGAAPRFFGEGAVRPARPSRGPEPTVGPEADGESSSRPGDA